jgi:hypothetical protein
MASLYLSDVLQECSISDGLIWSVSKDYQVTSSRLTPCRLSLVGPAMSDAITNLGGGGLSSPWLANLANSLSYAFSCLSTILGGPVINKIGIKWSCLIAAVAMPLHGSAYYVNARFDNTWYLLTANVRRDKHSSGSPLQLMQKDYQRHSIGLSLRWRDHGNAVVPKAR